MNTTLMNGLYCYCLFNLKEFTHSCILWTQKVSIERVALILKSYNKVMTNVSPFKANDFVISAGPSVKIKMKHQRSEQNSLAF